MEKITGEKDHIDGLFFCQTHDLIEGVRTVVATMSISLVVADMVVCCDEDTNGVSTCMNKLDDSLLELYSLSAK